jgi:hypothetical protein
VLNSKLKESCEEAKEEINHHKAEIAKIKVSFE